ncbi:MAG: type II toxin-antitoxin system PemK/MazF family toxin [Campylobacterota bacterium]|nr:type II toxin-antitoxin system PemK/MazF family toxin [Campylobacterota bacterium]
MEKFDEWNEVKKVAQIKERRLDIKPREIFWAKIGQNIGDEEYGKGQNFTRPVIVIRQLSRDLFLGVPTTTTLKDNDYFHLFEYSNKQRGDIQNSAMILQLKVFSKKRLMNKIGTINKNDFEEILTKARKLLISPI